MIEEPEIRRKMGYEAYHKFQSEFSIDKFAHRIHSILTSVNQSGGVKYVEYIGPKYGFDNLLFKMCNGIVMDIWIVAVLAYGYPQFRWFYEILYMIG